MGNIERRIMTAILAAVLFTGGVSGAHAIKCKRNIQIMKDGTQLITPYCEDKYLAEVARSYGIKVTAKKLRNNPGIKTEICQFIGHDSRVYQNCQTAFQTGPFTF